MHKHWKNQSTDIKFHTSPSLTVKAAYRTKLYQPLAGECF